MRRRWTIVFAIVAVAVIATGATTYLGTPDTSGLAPEEPASPDLVELESGQALWPYYSSERGVFKRSSAINVVVYASLDETMDLLLAEDWDETDEDEETDLGSDPFAPGEGDDAQQDDLGWGLATGAERFAYVVAEGRSHWLRESAQVHDGDYYGARHHLRLYEAPGEGEAVAIQAHAEYFDWFTLRHAVTSIEEAQLRLENQLLETLGFEQVWRQRLGNTGPHDSNGWVTFVVLSMLSMMVAGERSTGVRERLGGQRSHPTVRWLRDRLTPFHGLVFAVPIGFVLGIRAVGVGLEWTDWLPMKAIAAVLFPVLAVGLPVVVAIVSTRLPQRIDAGILASSGFFAAVVLDYLHLGVRVLPVEILLHRTGLITALGLLAVGGAHVGQGGRRDNGYLLAGVAIWCILLAMSLFGVI